MKPFLTGTVAFVTGASNGLGRAAAILLAQAGASVTIIARSEDALDAVAAEIAAEGGDCLAVTADLGSDADIAAAVRETIDRFGKIDFMINCGGTIEGIGKHIWDTTAEEWDNSLQTNATGAMNLIRHIAPVMRDQRNGRMQFITSAATLVPTEKTGAYAASKAVVNHLVQTLVLELGPMGIQANVFNPGPIDTDSFRKVSDAIEFAGQGQTSPQAPEVAARLILWLCSPETAGVTGEFINWNHPNTKEAFSAFLKTYQVGTPVFAG